MDLTIISDTHGRHEELGTLCGEVLIHCGDMFNIFSRHKDEFARMDDWFAQQDFEKIICIGGNHDFALQDKLRKTSTPFKNAIVLNGTSYAYKGVRFFGAPWVPELASHAFFVEDSELEDKWSQIPEETDILITHTPPAGILDVSSLGLKLGCPYLSARLESVNPQLHCFGHVHASSGAQVKSKTTYINASMVGRGPMYTIIRKPYTFHYAKV